jgi:NACHT domain
VAICNCEGARHPSRPRRLEAVRRPTPKNGAAALALLLLPWAWALVQVVRHDRLDSGAVGIVIGLSVGLPALWLAWAGYLEAAGSGAKAGERSMAQMANQLADAVGKRWKAEATVLRLYHPYPLPVSWVAADSSLTDSWDALVRRAGSDPAKSRPADTWAGGPEALAGAGGDLVEVLARVPTGRLVVLGEPGAGKTTLMIRLVLDLLARRTDGGPIPVLVPVASWDPSEQNLRKWLAAQLVIDHPVLANPPAAGIDEATQADALLAAGLILPILDGIDEMREEYRGLAIDNIDEALWPGEQLVVTSRTEDYADAVRPDSGIEVNLGAAAVELRPLDADATRSYLSDDAAGPIARARWDPVLAVLGTGSPAALALGTPLMVGLARDIYNPRPGERAEKLREPAELCAPALSNQAAVETLLLDAFIPAAYRGGRAHRRKAQNAEKWLTFLAHNARNYESMFRGPDLGWWQLIEEAPGVGRCIAVAAAVMAGVVAGNLAGVAAGVGAGLGTWFVAGVVACGFTFGLRKRAQDLLEIDKGSPMAQLTAGVLVLAIMLGAVVVSGVVAGMLTGIISGILAGVAAGVGAAAGVLAGLSVPRLLRSGFDARIAASPRAVLRSHRRAAIAPGILAGIWAGALTWVLAGRAAGILAGVVAGLAADCDAVWPSYGIARNWLAIRRRLPWRLVGFLDDAHQRGVLRQAGAVYQFRHIQLLYNLARRPSLASQSARLGLGFPFVARRHRL